MICPVIRRVSKTIEFELERKFPGSCKVAVRIGDSVEPESVVAHCEISAGQRLIKIAHSLGVSARDVKRYLLRKVGDRIYRGEIIARKKNILGLGKREIRSPADGIITEIDANGDIIVKFLPTLVKLAAGAKGIVATIGQESIFIKSSGIQIKGHAGSGRVRDGLIKLIAQPSEFITPQKITADSAGNILVGGSVLERAAVEKALTLGVHGIVVGGINHRDFLSLGVGSDVGITVLVTEGFGIAPIGKDIFETLRKFENRFAFVSGEAKNFFIPVQTTGESVTKPSNLSWKELAVGDIVRVFKVTSEDLIGRVESISKKDEILNSGLPAEVASVKFLSGNTITVASANLEIIEV